jgi:CRISPR-associated endonuclease/helicase Cas3
MPRGVFTLEVPTGGGKTFASLGFALDHAKVHGMDRIVYGIPFTSVIDQTAAIFRDVLGDDIVLEHHSAIQNEQQDRKQEGERDVRDKMRLAMEDWAAPVIVTTNVQLFESLFASRTSRCRKLHNLVNAVIILDEAQTIPLPVLRPCVAILDESNWPDKVMVAPFTGAWIETCPCRDKNARDRSRSLHGSVDRNIVDEYGTQ